MPGILITQWGIMGIIIIYFYFLGRNIKKVPNYQQNFWELIIENLQGFIRTNIGEKYKNLTAYFFVLSLFLLISNLTGLVGIKNPSVNYSFCLALGIINFALIQYCGIKNNGIKGYLRGYLKPIGAMLPFNIMERVLLPFTLSLRLFGNMLAAYLILEILYDFLTKISPVLGVGIPIPIHFYFDIFDGTIQTIIFILLSMINIKLVSEH